MADFTVNDADQHPSNSHEYLKKSMAAYMKTPSGNVNDNPVQMTESFKQRMQTQQMDMDFIYDRVGR